MRTNKNNKGLVLVAVLWMVVVLLTIVAVVGRTTRLDTKVSIAGLEQVRCKWACRAGMEHAIAVLIEDLRESDSLTDTWSDNTDFNNVMLEQCRVRIQVTEEAGKLNINTMTREQLLLLPYMDERIADTIIDWRDADDTPTGEGVEGGYYQNLPFKYNIRNGPFKTTRELLLVRDVTEDLFYGKNTNLNGQLGLSNTAGTSSPSSPASLITSNTGQPATSGTGLYDQGWISYLTCYANDRDVDANGNPKTNINQADEGQLQQSLGITAGQARWIVQRRSSGNFQSIADLLSDGTSGSTSQQSSQGSGSGGNQGEPIDTQTFIQIADKITIGGNAQGKININTVPEEVLTILLGGTDTDRELAMSMVAYRATLAYGMQSIGELMNVQSMNIETFKRIANNITVRSDVFTIRCVATAIRANQDGTTLVTEAVVDRSKTPCQVLYWYQGAGN